MTRTKPAADIYQGNNLVAHLERTQGGLILRFVPDAVLNNGFLATSIRSDSTPVETVDLPPFFLNLLPEGARLRLLLEAAKSKDDSLALLLKTGWDTIGDVAVLPHSAKFQGHAVSVPQSQLAQVSFWDLFYRGIGKNADASLPGAQEKISSSAVAFGVRTASHPSAILKLNPSKYPLLVQNEAFFLRMADYCGIRTNKAEVVRDRVGEFGLLVTRFDRKKEGKELRKIHQEDACQLLNENPANKYDVSMRDVAEALVKVCSAPAAEIARLLRLYAFSYVIGNCDLHAKNISVFWDKVVRLTPAYDVLSTLPYRGLNKLMALPLDGKRKNFRSKDFVAFGLRFGVPEKLTLAMVESVCTRSEPWIGKLSEIGFDSKTTESLEKEIATRIAHLRR